MCVGVRAGESQATRSEGRTTPNTEMRGREVQNLHRPFFCFLARRLKVLAIRYDTLRNSTTAMRTAAVVRFVRKHDRKADTSSPSARRGRGKDGTKREGEGKGEQEGQGGGLEGRGGDAEASQLMECGVDHMFLSGAFFGINICVCQRQRERTEDNKCLKGLWSHHSDCPCSTDLDNIATCIYPAAMLDAGSVGTRECAARGEVPTPCREV